MSTLDKLALYRADFIKYKRDHEVALSEWRRRHGETGAGGKWDAKKQKYTFMEKPVLGPEPKFPFTDAFMLAQKERIRKEVLGL